jgi:hypothetical protein
MAAINSSSGLSPFVPLQGGRPTDAQQPASSPTSSAAQLALAPAAARPAMADEARPTRGTLVAANDSQHRALDAATDKSATKATHAKYASVFFKFLKFTLEAPISNAYMLLDNAKHIVELGTKTAKDLDKAVKKYDLKGHLGIKELGAVGLKSVKSFVGTFAALPLAIADGIASLNTRKQVAQYAAGAATFRAQCEVLTAAVQGTEVEAAARRNLYGVDEGSRAQATETAQAWLKHKEASSKGNALGVALGAAAGVQAATDAGVTVAYEVASKATKDAAIYAAKGALTNALPFVGIAGAAIGLATSVHALSKQNAVRNELNAQRQELAAARNQTEGLEGEVGMGGALANVFKASQAKLEIRTTANHIQMAGSGLAIAGNATALAGNVAAVTGVGLVASAGLAVTSMAFSLMSLCASIGAMVYDKRMNAADAGEKEACTPGNLENAFKDLEGEALDKAKAELAGSNKFYALVYLAETLQNADPGSPAFKNAEQMLGQLMGDEKARAIITLARGNPAAIDINSAAVNELGKALYGAPVGQVAAKPAAAADVVEGGAVAAYDLPEASEDPPAMTRVPTTLDFHDPSMLRA